MTAGLAWGVRQLLIEENMVRKSEPESATLGEILSCLNDSGVTADRKAKILGNLKPRGAPITETVSAPSPIYTSWDDYLSKTTNEERLQWCRKKAKKANQARLMSGKPTRRITGEDVLKVLIDAQGRCKYCGSLAVELRPSTPSGTPLPWAPVGRRIGSLGHNKARIHGGGNELDNLSWCCLWCNTWQEERRPGALDHGAIQ